MTTVLWLLKEVMSKFKKIYQNYPLKCELIFFSVTMNCRGIQSLQLNITQHCSIISHSSNQYSDSVTDKLCCPL